MCGRIDVCDVVMCICISWNMCLLVYVGIVSMLMCMWMDGWRDGWLADWMDGWMDQDIPILYHIVPSLLLGRFSKS